MKKLIVVMMVLICLVLLVACDTETGLTPEEICTNQVIAERYPNVNVIGTTCRFWKQMDDLTDMYVVQVDSSIDGQGYSDLYYVTIKYNRVGSKISYDELIDCTVMAKVKE